MKKLMIGAVAAIAASTAFCVESANVVGYASEDLRSGFIAQGACFIPVAGESIDLTSIIVTGYDKDEGTEEEVMIQSLDRLGATVPGSMYTWIDVVDGSDVYYGWLNGSGDFVEPGDAVFTPGEAVWVKAPSADFKLQYSGQVPTTDQSNILRNGFKLVANPTPVTVDLTDVVVDGYDKDEGTEEEVMIQSLDRLGATVPGSMYTWIDVVDGSDVYYGWLNGAGDFVEVGEKTFTPGEAVWVKSPSTQFNIVFPGVSL